MPEIYAPQKMTVTTIHGTGISLAAKETRMVSAEMFAAAILQGALPAPSAYHDAAIPTATASKAVARLEPAAEQAEFDAPSTDNADIIGEGDEEDRYPAPVEAEAVSEENPVVPDPVSEERVIAALRRIMERNDPAEFNATGVPKARVLTNELGGNSVVAEVREAAWEKVMAEVPR